MIKERKTLYLRKFMKYTFPSGRGPSRCLHCPPQRIIDTTHFELRNAKDIDGRHDVPIPHGATALGAEDGVYLGSESAIGSFCGSYIFYIVTL